MAALKANLVSLVPRQYEAILEQSQQRLLCGCAYLRLEVEDVDISNDRHGGL